MKSKRGKSNTGSRRSKSRKISLQAGILLALFILIWGIAGEWYVHHNRTWLHHSAASLPRFFHDALTSFGNPLADITDGLGWTGHDAVYEYDEEAPSGSVTFAGLPARKSSPAPNDIQVLNRGEFIIGWSPSLRHPAWVAYHVKAEAKFEDGKRPSFLIDRTVPSAPRPDEYTHSGFDRGHMAPNHAIVSRYGDSERRKTFQMSNICPQYDSLNRAVWRDVEHRIADLWTERYGEIWVVVGTIPSACSMRIGNGIDVPESLFQVIIAQEGMDVRALAVLFPNKCPWDAWAARYIITIDELEELTGFDFNPDMPSFIQDPLEAELPSRLWPVRFFDIFKQILHRFAS